MTSIPLVKHAARCALAVIERQCPDHMRTDPELLSIVALFERAADSGDIDASDEAMYRQLLWTTEHRIQLEHHFVAHERGWVQDDHRAGCD